MRNGRKGKDFLLSLGLKRSVIKFPMSINYWQTPKPLAPSLPASLGLLSVISSLCCNFTRSFFFPLMSLKNALASSFKKLLPQPRIPLQPLSDLSLAILYQTSRKLPMHTVPTSAFTPFLSYYHVPVK